MTNEKKAAFCWILERSRRIDCVVNKNKYFIMRLELGGLIERYRVRFSCSTEDIKELKERISKRI